MSITRSPVAAGGASQLGRITKVCPTRSARKYFFQTSRHSSSCASRRAIEIGSGETPAARSRPHAASISSTTSCSSSGAHCAKISDCPAATRMIVSVSRISTPPVNAPTASARTSAAPDGTAMASSIQRVDTRGAYPNLPTCRSSDVTWPASANNAALCFATATLPRLAHLALALHGRLLVITPPLDLLQDSFLRHLLLQDLQRLGDGIPDFNFQRSAEQCLQA